MTGPEHYREAERLLADGDGLTVGVPSERNVVLARAHAALALVAAQVEAVIARGPGDCDQSWIDAVWKGATP